MTIKLLATDLDGTLLRGGQPVSAGNIAAAQAAAKAGTIVTIATGRMYRAAMPVAEALGLDVPIITYNGALIKSTSGKVYYEQYLDEDICRRITDFAAARGWYLQTYSGDELYYSDYGDLEIPSQYTVNGIWLSKWVDEQRQIRNGKRKGKSLTEEQISKLDSIGMRWVRREEVQWQEQYYDVREYMKTYGNVNIPQGYKSPSGKCIGLWLQRQRKKLREGKLSTKQEQLLRAVGI